MAGIRNLDRLRPFTAEDVALRPIQHLGPVVPSAEEEAAIQAEIRASWARSWNERFNTLFPAGAPVTDAHIGELIERFRADTEPTDRDRNRVRAHRYEEASKQAAKHFQTLGGVEAQIQVFERYFNDLFLLLTKGTHEMTPLVRANSETTARDIADLILIGSINRAVIRYGLVPEHQPPGAPPPWYWHRRKEFFEQGRSLAEVPQAQSPGDHQRQPPAARATRGHAE